MFEALHTTPEPVSAHPIPILSAQSDHLTGVVADDRVEGGVAPESCATPAYCVFMLRLWYEQPSTGTTARQRLLLESYENRVRYGFGDAAELAAFVDGILARMAPVAEP